MRPSRPPASPREKVAIVIAVFCALLIGAVAIWPRSAPMTPAAPDMKPLADALRRLEGSLETLLTAPAAVDAGALGTLQKSLAALPEAVAAKVKAEISAGGAVSGRSTATSSGPRRRNAVVGLAKGIEALKLYRFVRSLRDSTGDPSVSGIDVVLFLDEADAPPGSALEWVLSTFGVIVKKFNPAAFPEEKHRGYHPSSYRWMLIRDWMRSVPAGEQHASVLFTDVRDAIFQADPFAAAAATTAGAPASGAAAASAQAPHPQAPVPVFMAFLEAKPRTIAECGWNAGWVRDCFGEAGLQAVGGNVISCSGTSLGTWESALAYANLLANEIAVNKCERNGVDQGMHNFYVFNGQLASALQPLGSSLRVVDNEHGFIATVQSMGLLRRDRAGRLLNEDGRPYALVHQYDRSQALEQQYDRQFVWLSDDALTIHK